MRTAKLLAVAIIAAGLLTGIYFVLNRLGAPNEPLIGGGQEVERPDIQFFYSATCPHCIAESAFLDSMSGKYPSLTIARYPINDKASQEKLRGLLDSRDAMEYYGVVPITFVGDEMFVGFDDGRGIGADIEAAATSLSGATDQARKPSIIERYRLEKLPLPVTAIVLGLLDGFNVCSLGALALILGLALVVRDRKRVLLLGGSFVLTTAVVYAILIAAWYHLFSILGSVIGIMQGLIGLAAAGAGVYFLFQFWRFRKYGPTCGFSGGRFITAATDRIQRKLGAESGIFAAALAILIFAAAITIIEFPCSAAVPLVFAGMLAGSGTGALASIGLISIFVLFYLLDELIVLGIAASRLRLWLSSPNVTTWAALIEGILLLGIGLWYVIGVI